MYTGRCKQAILFRLVVFASIYSDATEPRTACFDARHLLGIAAVSNSPRLSGTNRYNGCVQILARCLLASIGPVYMLEYRLLVLHPFTYNIIYWTWYIAHAGKWNNGKKNTHKCRFECAMSHFSTHCVSSSSRYQQDQREIKSSSILIYLFKKNLEIRSSHKLRHHSYYFADIDY